MRFSSSSVLKWPERRDVEEAARSWAHYERGRRRDLVRLGYFGSYARGDAGVGSDLDLVAVVADSSVPFERRAADWDLNALPVPAEILVYTTREWTALLERGGRFAEMLQHETRWLE